MTDPDVSVLYVEPEDYELNVKHEMSMRTLGVEGYWSRLDKARSAGKESSTRGARKVLRRLIGPFASAIDTYANHTGSGSGSFTRDMVQLLNAEVLAFLTLKTVLDTCARRTDLLTVATAVGSAVEEEIRFRVFKRDHADELYDMIKVSNRYTRNTDFQRTVFKDKMRKAGETWESWSKKERAVVGVNLIDILIQSTGAARKNVIKASKKTRYYVDIAPELLDALEQSHEYAALACPTLLPTLIPPKPWTRWKEGGYWTDAVKKQYAVKNAHRLQAHALDIRDAYGHLDAFYTALNTLQATSWQINTLVYHVADHLWHTGVAVGNLPEREATGAPVKPLDIGTNEDARRAYRREAKAFYDKSRERSAARLLASRLLSTAGMLHEKDAFWFPWQADFRGRMYTIPQGLSPQGCDLAKALLMFGKGKKLGPDGSAWLAVHGANLFGAKGTLEERISWVYQNEKEILDAAHTPFNTSFWASASKPFQFLAFCFEWRGYLKDGEDHVSHLPVAVDGSCNGLQHLAALSGDAELAARVNVIPSDKPADIYLDMAAAVQAKLEQDAPTKSQAVFWKDKVTRGLCKRPVMTYPYGLNRFGLQSLVHDYAREVGLTLPHDQGLADYMAATLDGLFKDVLPGADRVMKYLQYLTGKLADAGKSVVWWTPLNFPVYQTYFKTKSSKVRTVLSGKISDLRVYEDTNEIDKRRSVNGIAPNIIHALDACHLMYTVNMLLNCTEELPSIVTVHDSYATHACDMYLLNGTLRHAFYAMYEEVAVMQDLYALACCELPLEAESLKKPPSCGDLNLDVVLQSDFFFS